MYNGTTRGHGPAKPRSRNSTQAEPRYETKKAQCRADSLEAGRSMVCPVPEDTNAVSHPQRLNSQLLQKIAGCICVAVWDFSTLDMKRALTLLRGLPILDQPQEPSLFTSKTLSFLTGSSDWVYRETRASTEGPVNDHGRLGMGLTYDMRPSNPLKFSIADSQVRWGEFFLYRPQIANATVCQCHSVQTSNGI